MFHFVLSVTANLMVDCGDVASGSRETTTMVIAKTKMICRARRQRSSWTEQMGVRPRIAELQRFAPIKVRPAQSSAVAFCGMREPPAAISQISHRRRQHSTVL